MAHSQMKYLTRAAVFATLAIAPALARAVEPPQVTTTTTTPAAAPRPGTARSRCGGCSDSARAKHDVLTQKLDSLRYEFSTRRFNRAEQEIFEKELATTLMNLQQLMESQGAMVRRAPTTVNGVFTGPVAGSIAQSGNGYTITVQTVRKGYLGVSLDGPSIGYPPEQPDVIRYIQYPRIASVDPASPAERAGLLMGDTLVAMNGTDIVENSITLSKILVPDEKVLLKVRRDGDAKEFRVVVGATPAYIARRITPVPMPAEAPMGRMFPLPPSQATRTEVGAGGRVRTAPPAEAVTVVGVPRYDEPAPTTRLFVFGNAVAGARVETLNEGLAKAIGAKEGVLVITAPPGSPAYVSGLRDGDVIVSVTGTPVATVRQLSTTLFDSDRENGVKIVILRDKKQQELTLRWK
jgi:membrane-associated protease RseP (regulator of RpoE activity)